MRQAMFHMKHKAMRTWNGSGGGLDRARAGLDRPGRPLAAAAAVLALALGVMVTACSSPAEIAESAGVAQSATPPTPPVPGAPDAAGGVAFTDNAKKDDASREFAYNWPGQVAAIPALVERFTAERDKLLAEQKTEWAEAVAEYGAQDCVACTNRAYEKSWEVVADLPRYLSLSASFYVYTGGAHGNGAHDALVWDREAKVAVDPKAMFASPKALQDALGAEWCKALKAERTKRLGEDYSEDGIFTCPPISDLTVLVGSSNKRSFDRIGLLAAPYVAGSYAEGTYEVTLPVTPAVLAALKPEYKPAFALGT